MTTDIDAALAEVKVLFASLARVETALQRLRNASLQIRLSDFPPCDTPVTDHRREHRAGPVPKITTDPELQAFILARIDRLTYQEIADAVAAHFPPERRVRKSAIQDWHRKTTQPDRPRRGYIPRITPRHPG